MVVISADGRCRVFDMMKAKLSQPETPQEPETTDLEPNSGIIFEQNLPPNVKRVQIEDVNDDGLNELVVTLTDRVVRTYQWRKSRNAPEGAIEGELAAQTKWEFADQVRLETVRRRRAIKSICCLLCKKRPNHAIFGFYLKSLTHCL